MNTAFIIRIYFLLIYIIFLFCALCGIYIFWFIFLLVFFLNKNIWIIRNWFLILNTKKNYEQNQAKFISFFFPICIFLPVSIWLCGFCVCHLFPSWFRFLKIELKCNVINWVHEANYIWKRMLRVSQMIILNHFKFFVVVIFFWLIFFCFWW